MGYANPQQQLMRKEALDNAYRIKTVVEEEQSTVEEALAEVSVKPDIFDQGYVFLRTYVPGWMMGLIILTGSLVLFKKQLREFIGLFKNVVNKP